MKYLYHVVIGLFAPLVMTAQTPYIFNYQGVARQSDGSPMADQTITVLASLISGFEGGPVEFQEKHVATTNKTGLFTIRIGDGDFVIGNLRNIDWSEDVYFLRIEVDPGGNENFITVGAAQLLSVPYALHAVTAENAMGGTVEDADTDPTNELQTLAIDGTQLTISDGNTVTLPSSETNGFWQPDGIHIFYQGGDIKVRNDAGMDVVEVGRDGNGHGGLIIRNANALRNIDMLHDADGGGSIFVRNDNEQTIGQISVLNDGAGFITTYGPNGERNASMSILNNNPDNGWVGVFDSEGDVQAVLYVDANGNGIISGDMKNFRTPHPRHENMQIVYASLEGPEAGAYLRGTGELVNGKGEVHFPEHFQHIVNESTMTVLLTPLSDQSQGLAVIDKGKAGFRVSELFAGKGNYAFDWEAKGVRRGYEQFEPVQLKERSADAIDVRIKEN
jgi:hypothetical protein